MRKNRCLREQKGTTCMKTKRLTRQIPRSLLAFVLLFAMLAQIVAIPAVAQSTAGDGGNGGSNAAVLFGDVNGDGVINSADVDLLARYLADDKAATIDLMLADVDDNGIVDLNDLLYLLT